MSIANFTILRKSSKKIVMSVQTSVRRIVARLRENSEPNV